MSSRRSTAPPRRACPRAPRRSSPGRSRRTRPAAPRRYGPRAAASRAGSAPLDARSRRRDLSRSDPNETDGEVRGSGSSWRMACTCAPKKARPERPLASCPQAICESLRNGRGSGRGPAVRRRRDKALERGGQPCAPLGVPLQEGEDAVGMRAVAMCRHRWSSVSPVNAVAICKVPASLAGHSTKVDDQETRLVI